MSASTPLIPGVRVALRPGASDRPPLRPVALPSGAWALAAGGIAELPEKLLRRELLLLRPDDPSPAEALRALGAGLARGRRSAGVLVVVEPDVCGAWATVAVAGTELPVVVRRAGWIDVRGQVGTPLGGDEPLVVGDDRVGLGPGDSLVLIGAAQEAAEERTWGDDVLSETLLDAAGAPADAIADAVVGRRPRVPVAVLRVLEAVEHRAATTAPRYAVGQPHWGRDARPRPPREARLRLVADPTVVSAARRFVASVLRSWRMPELVGGDAELLVSELVTNAVRYGGRPLGVALSWDGDHLRLEVGDQSASRPVVRPRSQESTGGRGMQLVDALATGWGVDPLPGGGKRVWAALPA